jgi:hypothetical protein
MSAVKKLEYVSDRMSYIILRGRWCNSTVLNVHAPTEHKIIYKQDLHTAKLIKLKLQHNNATIIEADKGKTMVIIHKHDLENKVNTFINENDIELKADPTQKMQKRAQDTIKQCTHNRPPKMKIHNSNAPTGP